MPSKLSDGGTRGSDEMGRFSYIARLLLAARGSLAQCDEDWILTDWKVPILSLGHVSGGSSKHVPLNTMVGSNQFESQPLRRAAGQGPLHLPPQDLVELLLIARSDSNCAADA